MTLYELLQRPITLSRWASRYPLLPEAYRLDLVALFSEDNMAFRWMFRGSLGLVIAFNA